MSFLLTMIQGGSMAVADSVPGVSGGTVAFILGFYDQFILALNHLVSGTKKERLDAVTFLAKLMCGWLIGFGASVLILGKIFDTHIYALCSLFMGLSVFALPLIIKEEKNCLMGKFHNLIFTLLGMVVVVMITYFNPSGGQGGSADVLQLSFVKMLYVFVVAMIAISAMVMPGISGSTLLLIFGLYVPVITGIKELMHLNFSYLPVLCVFGLGVVIGILTVIKLVRYGLEHARSQMIYLVLGLMIGSLYAIVMGPTTLDQYQPAMTFATFSPLFFILGGLILGALQMLKKLAMSKLPV